jgi:hypothetical protein
MIVTNALLELGLDEFCRRYSIRTARHAQHPNLVLFKYHQTDSPMSEPVVQHCRGLILDEASGWQAVAWPYNKFFNYGEGKAAEIDWSTARVYEKLDGSLMTLYWYASQWHVATSGKPDAAGEVRPGLTFAELFWRTFDKRDLQHLSTGSTYMLELCCPENRIVVQHAEPQVYMHGARNLWNGKEYLPAFLEVTPFAPHYPMRCIEEVIKEAELRNPLKHEGYVVVDGNFNRVKVKSSAYIALHHSRDQHTRRRLANIIRAGEAEEFKQAVDVFPHMKPDFEDLSNRHARTLANMSLAWSIARHIDGRKEFAMAVKDLPYAGYLFFMKSGKEVTPGGYLAGLTDAAYLRLVDAV